MDRMRKMCEIIENELGKIAEKGLTTSNIDTAFKLIDMHKDLKNVEYWDIKKEYYEEAIAGMRGGYSRNPDKYSERGGRKRDSMGRYARDDGMDHGLSHTRAYSNEDGLLYEYLDAKQSYRSGRNADNKQRLMDSLEGYMDEFTAKIKEMHRDADTPEERDLIGKFMAKLQNIR